MKVYLILSLMLVIVGSLIVLIGFVTLRYFDFLDRERRTQCDIDESVLSNSIEIRGQEGEQKVNRFMLSILKSGEYYLSNLLVPINDFKKVEVDGVLITRKGIFCIETKYWKGKIVGYEKDDMWYQTKCGKSRQVKNPLLQNSSHCKAIEKALYFDFAINNCVILYSTLDLNNIVSDHVYNLESFGEFYSSLNTSVISRRKIRLVYDRLSLYLATKEAIRKHKEEIKLKYTST